MKLARSLAAGALSLLALSTVRPSAAAPGSDQIEGTYTYKDASNKKEIRIASLGKGKLKVLFQLSYTGAPPAIGAGAGDATLSGDVATYASGACSIAMAFQPGNRLSVKQTGSDSACGFGHLVTADGQYAKTRGTKPSVALVPQDAPPQQHTVAELVAAAGTSEKEAVIAKPRIEQKRSKVVDLASEHAAALKDVATRKAAFEKAARAANAAYKKFVAAGVKANAKPSASELAATADPLHTDAIRLGKELSAARATLRKNEDDLAQITSEVSQIASDADADVKDIRDATTALGKLASGPQKPPADDVAKGKKELATLLASARAGATAAHSGASSVGAAAHFTGKGYGPKRDKAEKDDAALAARITALGKQQESLKAAPGH